MLYAALEAPFLFAVQIIVYTGAILMLFLFVLMLVGVDASDSVVETIRGQRVLRDPRRPAARRGAGGRPRPDLARHRGRPRRGQRGRQHPGARQHPVLPLRLRLRDHQRAADHRRRRRDGARPPRAAHARSRPRPTLAAQRVTDYAETGHAPRSAAAPGRLRPPQRGRHPGAAARRHRRADLGLPGARRPRHGPLRAGARPTTSSAIETQIGWCAARRPRRRPRRRPPPRKHPATGGDD